VSQIRQAALSLHGLGDADREWMLAQLPEARRDELRRLIAELDALGFPRGEGLAPAPTGAPPRAPRVPTAAERLEPLAPKTMYRALAGESSELVAALLRRRQWRWGRGLLRRFDRQRRRAIAERAAVGVPMSPRVERELLALLCGKVGIDAPGDHRRAGEE